MTKPTKSQLRREAEAQIADSLLEAAADLQQRNGAARNRAITTAFARDEIFRGQLDASLSAIFKNKVVAKPYKAKRRKLTGRQVNLLLSDLHFGAALDPREVRMPYGPHEEARRIAAVLVQTAEYKPHYRDETELLVHLAGDIIQNQLHDQRDGTPLAEQIAAAIHYLTQGLAFLSTRFKKVTVRCTPGNHGRFVSRHKERATFQKWDSIETTIYYALSKAVACLPNVSVEIGYTPFYLYESFGKKGMVTHGDTVIRPGYPGSNIAVGSVRGQINEFNAPRPEDDRVSLFAVGHVHTASVVHMGNGTVFVSNGALIPPDSYAGSIGIHDATCGQQLWESVPGHIFGDHRFLVVDEFTDRDKALEKVVQPFKGF